MNQNKNLFDQKIAIIGASGHAKEIAICLSDVHGKPSLPKDYITFFVDREYFESGKNIWGHHVKCLEDYVPNEHHTIIGIGDPNQRERIFSKYKNSTQFPTIIHPTVIKSIFVTLSEGVIIFSGTVITCDIAIGLHSHINRGAQIGHDSLIGRFATISPGAIISGNCRIGDRVYIGTNAAIREKISICNDVIIGMGASVVKNIYEPGTYVGVPCKKIQ